MLRRGLVGKRSFAPFVQCVRTFAKHEFANWESTNLRPSTAWMPHCKHSFTANSPQNSPILVEEAPGIKVAVFNRHKNLNALNEEMTDLLTPLIHKWENNQEIYAIILRSTDSRAFCAGGDIIAVTKAAQANPKTKNPLDFFWKEYRLNHLIGSCSTPVISLLDGFTMGGGVGLSIHGKFRVATENTVFAMPETAIGLFPDVGATHKLTRLEMKNLGAYLCLTGARLSGWECKNVGICTHFIPSHRLPLVVEQLTSLTTDTSPNAVNEVLCEAEGVPEDPKVPIFEHAEEIEKMFGGSTVKSIVKNLQSSDSHFAAKSLKQISAASPTSLKVTLQQLKNAREMTLEQCLQQDYNIVSSFIDGTTTDFFEGVRAQVIDKTKDPKWSPNDLDSVSSDLINKIFAPKPDHSVPFLRIQLGVEESVQADFDGSWGKIH